MVVRLRNRWLHSLVALLLFLVAPLVWVHAAASTLPAGLIIVTSAEDTTAVDGLCTLREAIDNANNDRVTHPDCAAGSTEDETITFDPSLHESTIFLKAPLTITYNKYLTVDGRGQKITLDGGNKVRPLNISNNSSEGTRIIELTFANGYGQLFNNYTIGGGGLTIFESKVVIDQSTFRDNYAYIHGGAISSMKSDITVSNSTFYNNTAAQHGGAIYNPRDTRLRVEHSTFSTNTASIRGGSGGAISSATDVLLEIDSNTFYNNAATAGGSIYTIGMAKITNNLFTRGYPDHCYPSWVRHPSNISDDSTCGSQTRSAAEIRLGPLADNGGPTLTHALLPGSIAIDARLHTDTPAGDEFEFDQRGFPRYVDHADVGNDLGRSANAGEAYRRVGDVGAYELQLPYQLFVPLARH